MAWAFSIELEMGALESIQRVQSLQQQIHESKAQQKPNFMPSRVLAHQPRTTLLFTQEPIHECQAGLKFVILVVSCPLNAPTLAWLWHRLG
jgi:hypothetical protein